MYNKRIFSCILIDHKLDDILKERWRGKYNEDVDVFIMGHTHNPEVLVWSNDKTARVNHMLGTEDDFTLNEQKVKNNLNNQFQQQNQQL